MMTVRAMQQLMETGKPFTVEVCTYDEKRDTGGELIKLGPAILSYRKKQTFDPKKGKVKIIRDDKKHRNNWENETLTIIIKANGHKRTIHKELVTLMNNERVI